jgi:hypothetical protein
VSQDFGKSDIVIFITKINLSGQIFFGRVAGFRQIGHNGHKGQIARTTVRVAAAFVKPTRR